MSLAQGDRLGSYEILSLIGSGGMGEVYRARDTRLNREVAIKVSSEQFSERFEQEAKTVASLNHPNICAIYDVGPNYLVMELVEGPTLEDRLKAGPLFQEEARGIAGQIAEALATAHEKAIVHRDLKPSNVKIRTDGRVKILDFGLAKVGTLPGVGDASPTMTLGHTQVGTILGSPGYMSPEQARGKPVDKRADIFAFGVILYEMLTGQKAFPGETVGDALAAVLTTEPDLTKAPAEVRTLLRLCLQKDPKTRLHDAGDAMALWEAATSVPPNSPRIVAQNSPVWPAIAGALLLATAVFAYLDLHKPPAPAPEVMRFESSLPARVAFASPGVLSISPDGRKVVFPAIGADGGRHLWMRTLEEVDAKPFEETSISTDRSVFWSPDSRSVVYADLDDKRLKKLDVSTGAIDNICEIPDDAFGGSWNHEDTILFASRKGIMRVPATGGMTSLVTAADSSKPELHANPVFLPDGKRFLYNRLALNGVAGLYAGDLAAQPAQQSTVRIAPITFAVRYVEGALLYMSSQTELVTQPFDPSSLKLSGEPMIVAQQLGSSTELLSGLFSVSDTGVLVYRRDIPRDLQLTLFDRTGKMLETAGNPARFGVVVLSPDGTKIAATETDLGGRASDIWAIDTSTGASNRLTFGQGISATPVWSPDSTRIAYESVRKGKVSIYIKAANGAGVEELVHESDQSANLTEWTTDGKYLIYMTGPPSVDIWALPLTGDRKPFRVIQAEDNQQAGHVSPDGRYIVYISNETGHREIYVQPFPPGPAAGKWMISRGTLGMPRWRSDGREIYYLAQDGWIMAVPVEPGQVFRAGSPMQLFQTPPVFLRATANPGTLADVSRDGKRFLIAMPPGGAREEFTVVVNWQGAKRK